jgi:hypothetical protein
MPRRRPVATSLLAAVFSMGLLLVGAGPVLAAATTRWVNDDELTPAAPGTSCADAGYTMIQDAVDDAVAGDTIKVCPGTYNESVTVTFALTFLGPNAGVSGNGVRGAEAVVTSGATTFNLLNGQNVTIDGFTITGAFGIYVSGSTTNTLIQNNITTGGVRALTLDAPGSNAGVLNNLLVSPVRSMHLSSGPYTNLTVSGNRFSGTGTIFFSGNSSITGFTFTDNDVLQSSNLASNISNGTVSGNTFDAPAGSLLDTQMSLHNSTVTDNTFDGSDANACFQLFGSQFGLVPSHHVTISDNTFSDCGGAAPFNYAIQLSNDVHDIDIENNDISSGFEGVNTRDVVPPWDVTDEIHINYNNITNNTSFGVRNGQQSGPLDAECNWWGAADGPGPVGPGSGDNVSPNVDYTPWLTDEAPGGPCIGGLASTPGKVTGGGQIEGDPLFSPLGELISLPALIVSTNAGSQANFGFAIQYTTGATAPKGNLTYQDRGANVRIKATSYEQLIIDGGGCGPRTHAIFRGEADVNGVSESLTVEVNDCGEPSSGPPPDTFKIDTDSYHNSGPLIGGNIKIH